MLIVPTVAKPIPKTLIIIVLLSRISFRFFLKYVFLPNNKTMKKANIPSKETIASVIIKFSPSEYIIVRSAIIKTITNEKTNTAVLNENLNFFPIKIFLFKYE